MTSLNILITRNYNNSYIKLGLNEPQKAKFTEYLPKGEVFVKNFTYQILRFTMFIVK